MILSDAGIGIVDERLKLLYRYAEVETLPIKIMSVYGYPHRLGRPVDVNRFVIDNTRAIGERMGFAPDKIHVECSNTFANVLATGGCKKRPLLKDGKPIHAECEMVAVYNESVLRASAQRLLQKMNSNAPVLISLWTTVARNCRAFVVDAFEVPDDELLPISLLTHFNIPSERIARGFEAGWTVPKTKAEADSLFFEVYVARLVGRLCATYFATCDIPPVLAKVLVVRNSMWAQILDQTLMSPVELPGL